MLSCFDSTMGEKDRALLLLRRKLGSQRENKRTFGGHRDDAAAGRCSDDVPGRRRGRRDADAHGAAARRLRGGAGRERGREHGALCVCRRTKERN